MYVKLFEICRYTQIKLVFIVSYDVVNDQFVILILKIGGQYFIWKIKSMYLN